MPRERRRNVGDRRDLTPRASSSRGSTASRAKRASCDPRRLSRDWTTDRSPRARARDRSALGRARSRPVADAPASSAAGVSRRSRRCPHRRRAEAPGRRSADRRRGRLWCIDASPGVGAPTPSCRRRLIRRGPRQRRPFGRSATRARTRRVAARCRSGCAESPGRVRGSALLVRRVALGGRWSAFTTVSRGGHRLLTRRCA